MEMRKLKDEIKAKNEQIALLEKKIAESSIVSPTKMDQMEISHVSFDFLLILFPSKRKKLMLFLVNST